MNMQIAPDMTARHTVELSPVGRMYLIENDHHHGSYFAESDHLPRGKDLGLKDALHAAQQERCPIAVWELNPAEGSMRDVSEDIARMWLDEWIGGGGNPEEDEIPAFILEHITEAEAIRIFSDNYSYEAVL